MSNLRKKLNITAADTEFEENGSKVVESIGSEIHQASAKVLTAYESIKDSAFIDYLNSKGYNGSEISDNISKLYDSLDELAKTLKEAADKAEY